MLQLFLLSFAVSLAVAYLTLRCEHLHNRFSGDVAPRGSHKVHSSAVCRIGGIAIFIGWLTSLAVSVNQSLIDPQRALFWTVCVLPAFVGGLTEDFTKCVSPRTRLLACFLSAALAYVLLDASVSRVDLYGFDTILRVPTLALLFTLFAMGGVAHSINIIDGLNGLASGVCLVALLALGYVAFNVGDPEILLMCGLGVGALLGFRVWNYPSGRIFCGDGGAYFVGIYVAIVSALLVCRHAQVSAWFPLLLVLYPVWETLFSVYRRRVLRGRPALAADKLHMHTLFYKRVKQPLGGGTAHVRRNSDASVSMLMFACGGAIPAVLWWSNGTYLLTAAFIYIFLYLLIYRRLVRFAARMKHSAEKASRIPTEKQAATLHRDASFRRTIREANKGR